ncbi:MAG TPA: pyruvate dehydrogenase (acetyl-transferring) E1 component subunit alpha [Trueperaceae bacterium]|nr:pyruvate dehydrogenase (acetyl-transferring) E1 component subunit alpha [Trueperaceae bacterium]
MEPLRYIAEDGTAADGLPFTADELVRGYRAVARARLFDDRAMTLQRQGKLGVYPPYRGQEAAQVGAVLALGASDWLVPSYRDTGAAITHGLPLSQAILYWRADPAGWQFPEGLRVLPFYIPIATQLLHAVGVASAGRYREEDWVALTFIGDGGSSEGDFHEALNFAAVYDAPVVLMVENNGWAISVPTEKQMKNPRIAERAAGYGIPGVVVDGNDLAAVWHASREAVARARAGEGPTLIEAVTYRMGPHTSSDDPSRYRLEEQGKPWEARDPVLRLRLALAAMGAWDDAREDALQSELKEEFQAAVREADAAPEPLPQQIVEQVFAEMTGDARRAWEVLKHG